MNLHVVRADPAGNVTLFVRDEVPVSRRAAVAKALMAMPRFGAEQVAFICPNGRIEMMGGEFCGNASRAYGMLLARQEGASGIFRKTISVSGCDRPICVEADTERGTASAEMPLPQSVEQAGVGTLVHLGGIAHLVVEGVAPDEAFFAAQEFRFAAIAGLEAYGVVFLLPDGTVRPLVKVRATDSLIWEGSCGSGTLAAAVAQSIGHDGTFKRTYRQPAGAIEATVERRNGAVVRAAIGGTVTLDPPCEVDVAL